MNIILIAVLLFIIAVFVSFIFNKKKEKQYEANFDEDVLKTKKDYKGSLNRYVNLREGKTILRYFHLEKLILSMVLLPMTILL